jgi:hypothetical protein
MLAEIAGQSMNPALGVSQSGRLDELIMVAEYTRNGGPAIGCLAASPRPA